MRKMKVGLVNLVALVLAALFLCGPAYATGMRVVASTPWVVPGSDFSFDLLIDGAPAEAVDAVKFNLTVSSPGGTVAGVASITQGTAGQLTVSSPLLIAPPTSTQSGLGDLFFSGRNSNLQVISNQTLTNGTALYNFDRMKSTLPSSGTALVARFLVRVGAGVQADQTISIAVSNIDVPSGGKSHPLPACSTAVPIKCVTAVPSLAGMGLGQAQAALASANLALGSVYDLDNSNGDLPLNVVLQQSLSAGSSTFCRTPVNLALNTPPTLTVNPVTTPTTLRSETLSGGVSAGSTITVSANTAAVAGTVTYPTSTTWSCTISALTVGNNTMTVTARDAYGNKTNAVVSVNFTAPLAITTAKLPATAVGEFYGQSLAAANGTLPYTWSIVSGSLPAGLSLDPSSGAITGKPAAIGTHRFTVQAADAAGATATSQLELKVNDLSAQWVKSDTFSNLYSVSAMTVDSAGNYYVAGIIYDSVNEDYFVAKHDASGNVLWKRSFDNSAESHYFEATGIAVDNAGSVYVVGGNYNGSDEDSILVKFDPSGNHLWTRTDGGLGQNEMGYAVAVDADGDIDIVGETGRGTFLAKYDQAGNRLWLNPIENPFIYTAKISTDKDSNIIVGGMVPYGDYRLGYAVAKFDRSGTMLWTNSLDGSIQFSPGAVAADADGNVYFTSSVDAANITDYRVGKFDPAGNLLWIKTHDGNTDDRPAAIAIDRSGNVLVTGTSTDWGQYFTEIVNNYLTVKYNAAGELLWSSVGYGTYENTGVGIGVSDADEVYVVGQYADSDRNLSYVQMKYAPVDLAIATRSLPAAFFSKPYSQTLSVAGGEGPCTWSLVSGSLPRGLTLNSATGEISGVPVYGGHAFFWVKVTDARGVSALQSFRISLYYELTVTTQGLGRMAVNVPYDEARPITLAVSGGTPDYKWSIVSGSLPPGLVMAESGGISGTATTVGVFPFTVQVTDKNGLTARRAVQLTVDALAITPDSLLFGSVNVPYSQTISAALGTAPYAWSIDSGKLPAGLALDGATGIISGTPTVAGTYTFVIRVTDAAAVSTAQQRSLFIGNLSEQWNTTSTAGNPPGSPRGVATDSFGNIFATGDIYVDGVSTRKTSKYDAAGNELWTKTTEVSGDVVQVMGYDVAVDGNGNVYALGSVGRYEDSTRQLSKYPSILTKYDSAGNELWTQVGDFDDNFWSGRITVDTAGNLYLTSTRTDLNMTVVDVVVKKLDGSGNVVWTRTYDSGGEDYPGDITTDAAGNVYVSATATPSTTRYLVLKYDAEGDLLKEMSYDLGAGYWRDTRLAADRQGNVLVAGGSSNTGNDGRGSSLLVKFSPAGELLWKVSGENYGWTNGIALAEDDTVYALEFNHDGVNSYQLVSKYDISGNRLWSALAAGEAGWYSDIATTGGNVVVTGQTWGTGGAYWTVQKMMQTDTLPR